MIAGQILNLKPRQRLFLFLFLRIQVGLLISLVAHSLLSLKCEELRGLAEVLVSIEVWFVELDLLRMLLLLIFVSSTSSSEATEKLPLLLLHPDFFLESFN